MAGARLAAPGHYLCWLTDFESGRAIGLVAEDWLHRRRTASTAGIVTRWLAPPGARTAALVGAGKMGQEFVRTLSHALPFKELRVASRGGDSAIRLVDAFGGQCGGTRLVAAPSVRSAIIGADVVVTITQATEAFLESGWLAPGALVLSMGGVPEVEFGVFADIDRLIIDDLDYALAQGDLHAWVQSGAIARDALVARIDADIGEVAVGTKPGRRGDDERILAVIQGMAVCDLAMAKTALDLALEQGVGQEVAI